MIRARLVGYNGRPVTGADFAGRGDQAKRLAEREFNPVSYTHLDVYKRQPFAPHPLFADFVRAAKEVERLV